MVTNDYTVNYMFISDHTFCYSNHALSSSPERCSEEEAIVFNDHKESIKESENHKSFSKGIVMVRHEPAINIQFLPEVQHVLEMCLKYEVAAFIESYVSGKMVFSNFLNLSVFPEDFGVVNNFLSLLLHFKHQILISKDDEIILVLKLIGWVLWKFSFT